MILHHDCNMNYLYVALFNKTHIDGRGDIYEGVNLETLNSFVDFMRPKGFDSFEVSESFVGKFCSDSTAITDIDFTESTIDIIFGIIQEFCKANKNILVIAGILIDGIDTTYSLQGIGGVIDSDNVDTFVTDAYAADEDDCSDALEPITDQLTDEFSKELYSLEDNGDNEMSVDQDYYDDKDVILIKDLFTWSSFFENYS